MGFCLLTQEYKSLDLVNSYRNLTMKFTLGQEKALRTIWGMFADPDSKYLVIEGPAGTGKSEVIKEVARTFTSRALAYHKIAGMPLGYKLLVTATTNKAVDSLASKGINSLLPDAGGQVVTVFSALGIRPMNGKLISTGKKPLHKTVLIVDEASYLDLDMMKYIENLTDSTCKVIFIGDPYQLTPINYTYAPVFSQGYETVELDEIMRNHGPIQDLVRELREFVKGNEIPVLKPNNQSLFHIKNEDEFVDTWLDSIRSGKITKLIGYENNLVITANSIAKEEIEKTAEVQVGDILVCNKYLNHPIRQIKTDAEVVVESVSQETTKHGIRGRHIGLNLGITVFCPNDFKDTTSLQVDLLDKRDQREVERTFADLRPSYSCTIHKSQGSTYQNVFINLDELNRLNDATLSRLLYVAVSRASERVYFMGTL